MQIKEKKAKRKINKVNVAAIIVSVIALLGLLVLCAGIGTIAYLLKDKPQLDLSDFNSQESSIIYDKDDNQIYELGTVIRQNVEYDDLPTSLVDAFVSIEDARFFEHSGFDIPRFTKAFLSNLKTMSFSQGGSTFTMQLVKNTYFVSDEEGHGAVKSIKRKVQEIALAIELEQKATKKEIFINYLNKLNFGGTNQNIRGVQKASQYYFGKDVNDLTLPESAMLAGVVNSPYTYNPFIHLEYAQDRRDEVLYQMLYHGYITENEYNLAIGTRVEDLLQDSTSAKRGSGEGTPYQAYIDYVVEEVYQLTGLDPYTTSMRIHTCMDKDIQGLMDNIQAGNVDDYFEYPDDEFEVASICLNNQTGEIVGILGGRNYADGGALLLNHATDQFKQPGSSIKPVLDYVQAFEVLGWSTSHCVVDKPLAYLGTNYIISNATNRYDGEMTLKSAVANSLNTPAISTIRELIDLKGNAYLVDYLTSMGYDIDLNDFDEQYGIGGKGLNVSCLQMAGAYAAMMNRGYYTKPHCITKIEFLNEKAPITPSYQSNQTVSEQACFLMSELLKNNVEGGYANLMGLFKNDDYKVYAKTGTTNWGTEGQQFGIKNGAIKDGWVVACTSDYSVATWMGYEKGQIDKPSSMSYDIYNKNIKGKITKLIIDETVNKFGTPKDISVPTGVNKITHIKKVGLPYVAPISGMDDEYVITGYIKSDSKYAKLTSPQSATVEDPTDKPSIQLVSNVLKIEMPKYPNEDMLKVADEDIDISLLKTDGSVLAAVKGNRLFDYTWVFGPIKYKADIYVDDNIIGTITSDDRSSTFDLDGKYGSGSRIKACAYYGYDDSDVKSASKCSDEYKVEGKFIAIPANKDYSFISELLKPYATSIEFDNKTEAPDEGQIGIVYRVEINGKQITFSNEETVDTLNIKNVKVYYYGDYKQSITLSKSYDSEKINTGDSITITATLLHIENEDKIEWSIEGIDNNYKGCKQIEISFQEEGKYKIYAECDDIKSEVIEIVVSDE